jgi:hypothetical protein
VTNGRAAGCDAHIVNFAPAVDPRLIRSIGRMPDLTCSAAVWRAVRRRARPLDVDTPCYETVRKLVLRERERRARLLAALLTMFGILTSYPPRTPEDVERIYRRRLRYSRRWMRSTAGRDP